MDIFFWGGGNTNYGGDETGKHPHTNFVGAEEKTREVDCILYFVASRLVRGSRDGNNHRLPVPVVGKIPRPVPL